MKVKIQIMSEQTKTPKIYVPGTSVKEYTFPSGDKVLRFSINLAKFAPFVKEYKNENGYINFNINTRKEIGPYGDSHSVSLDTFKPNKNKTTTVSKANKPTAKKTVVESAPAPDNDFV